MEDKSCFLVSLYCKSLFIETDFCICAIRLLTCSGNKKTQTQTHCSLLQCDTRSNANQVVLLFELADAEKKQKDVLNWRTFSQILAILHNILTMMFL